MDYLQLIVTITGVHLVAAMSPGPNFFISAKHGLSYSRQAGLFTTAGVATGTLIHVILGFLGLSAIVAQSIWLYNLLKYLGAVYLIYLGAKSLLSKDKGLNLEQVQVEQKAQIPNAQAYRIGILTNLSNPKAAVYFLALFTTVISPGTPFVIKLILIVLLPIISWLWYSLVAVSFSFAKFKRLYTRFQGWINVTFGILMIGLGLKIALSRK